MSPPIEVAILNGTALSATWCSLHISMRSDAHMPNGPMAVKTRFLGTDAEEARSNRDQTLPNMNPGRGPIQDHIASCIQTCRGSVAFTHKSFTCVCVCVSFQFVKASLHLNAAFCKHRMFVCVCVFFGQLRGFSLLKLVSSSMQHLVNTCYLLHAPCQVLRLA